MKPPALATDEHDYRTDIDGLRGIAVLSVIVFHLNSRLAPGGFVGVDIFFVISGYLISLHIFREIESGRFSLAEFYRRRIKRIAPAMVAVVGATLLLTQILFVPDDAEVAAEAAIFSLFSLANVYFWRFLDSSYFSAPTDEQPFLHLWSLGVEEQFYILWPLLLIALYRLKSAKRFILFCAIVAALSFLLGDVLFPHDSSFVFYMLPTRAGELLMGALAAQWILRRPVDTRSHGAARGLSVAGALLVFGSIFWTSETEPFPGWRAIPPTLGAAMLIVAGHYRRTVPTDMLRWKPLVWLGVISYSAYLWHWPLLAIPRYFGVEFDLFLGAATFLAALAIGWLSYRYIEQPARQTRNSLMRVAWQQYVAPATLLAIIAVAVKISDGYGLRSFIPEVRDRLAAAELETKPAFESDYICQRWEVQEQDLVNPKCVVGKMKSEDPGILLWGDSNASHYVGMLGAFANIENFAFRNVVAAGCPPVMYDLDRIVNANKLSACSSSSEIVTPYLLSRTVVWIGADWLTYERQSDRFLSAFEATVREIRTHGPRVVVLAKAPVISAYDRRCKQKSVMIPGLQCDYPSAPLSEDIIRINAKMKAIADRIPGVTFFDANPYLCPGGNCSLRDETGKLIYFDSSHISLDASWRLGERIASDGVPDAFRQ